MPLSRLSANKAERREPENITIRNCTRAFINEFQAGRRPDYELLTRLYRLAAGDDEQADDAVCGIFCGIIEPLCDDFSRAGVEIGNEVMTRIISFVRQTPQGRELDRLLTEREFHRPADIIKRYRNISRPRVLSLEHRKTVRKVIVLSRVTTGADIAITSVIVHRLRRSLPLAEIVLIGPRHLPSLFPELDNCRTIPFVYKNSGRLFEKMTSWPPLLKIVTMETENDPEDTVLLFDPDSRLTQLGLLPLLDDHSTCYFPSRSWQPGPGESGCLSSLTNQWLNRLLDEKEEIPPYLVLHNEGHGYNTFCQGLKARGCRFIMVMNLGVGNNPCKKISRQFENQLIMKLVREPGTILILDRGHGRKESGQTDAILTMARRNGIKTDSLAAAEIPAAAPSFNSGILAFDGSIDALGKIICAADCFVGYDSCGQHLAAATGTPAVIIFAGAPSSRFIERWAPATGNNITLEIKPNQTSKNDMQSLITTVCDKVRKIKNNDK
ncbi:glycosyltransferase family 9 protein [Desulfobacterota bacterium M19]